VVKSCCVDEGVEVLLRRLSPIGTALSCKQGDGRNESTGRWGQIQRREVRCQRRARIVFSAFGPIFLSVSHKVWCLSSHQEGLQMHFDSWVHRSSGRGGFNAAVGLSCRCIVLHGLVVLSMAVGRASFPLAGHCRTMKAASDV